VTDVEAWWMSNEQVINLRSEHGWTIDVQAASAQNFVGLVENVKKIIAIILWITHTKYYIMDYTN
jgi:hypothetical protein